MTSDAEFERILRETQSAVRAYIAGLGVSPDDVDDVAQEVYLEFYKGGSATPEGVEPLRWLKGVARNLCMDRFRRARRREERRMEVLAVILDRASAACRRAVDRADVPEALERCLQILPGTARRVIELRYRHSLTSAAVGRRLGMSAEAVRILLYRIRAGLRDCLERRLAGEGRL